MRTRTRTDSQAPGQLPLYRTEEEQTGNSIPQETEEEAPVSQPLAQDEQEVQQSAAPEEQEVQQPELEEEVQKPFTDEDFDEIPYENPEVAALPRTRFIDITEKYDTVADIIRARRLEQSVELEEINRSLRIPVFFLECLENSNYSEITSGGINSYTIKQNVRSICSYLGFDNADKENVLSILQKEMEKAGLEEHPQASPETPMPFGDDDTVSGHRRGALAAKLPQILIAAIVILLIFILFLSKIAPFVNSRNAKENKMDFAPLIKPEYRAPLLLPIPALK